MVKRFALFAVVATTGCTFPEQPLPPGDREVVVHAILDPSQRYQLVRVSMTDGSNVAPSELDDAAVSITTPDGTRLFAAQDSLRDSTGKGHGALPDYRIDLQAAGVGLAPGGTYLLRIVLRSGAVITGATAIPTATPAPLPAWSQFDRRLDTLKLSWSHVPGARAYEVQVWSDLQIVNGPNYTYYNFDTFRYAAFADTAVTLAGGDRDWQDNDIFGQNTHTRVIVYAVDDNYYEYYRLLGDPYIGVAPSRLAGGLGVFGSVVPLVQRQLTVK